VRSTVLGVALFALADVLGSAISPVACEFLNDEDWIGHVLPTEKQTQVRAYFTRMSLEERVRFVQVNSVPDCKGLPQKDDDRYLNVENKCWAPLLEKFEMEESALQLKGTDSTEHLNRLHERLTVLRGATFSGFVLLLLIVFALCSGCRAKLKEAKRTELIRRAGRQLAGWGAFLPSLLIVWFALKYGSEDLMNAKVDDMPIMEAVLGLLGVFGVYLAARSIKPRAYINVWTCVFALFFTVLVYGGYAWTEVNYDQQVHQVYVAGSGASWTPSVSEKPTLQAATNWHK
jgi:hypothetical protein